MSGMDVVTVLAGYAHDYDFTHHERWQKMCAAIVELIEATKSVRSVANNAEFVSGVCCCGSCMDAHDYGSNHSPVDSGTYYGAMALDRLDCALSAVTGGGE